MKTEGQQALGEFGFEDGNVNFFEETSPVTTTDEIVEQVITDDLEEEVVPAKVKKVTDEEEEITFDFGTNPGEEDEEEVLVPAGKDNVATLDNKGTLEFLKSKGLVNFDLADGEELTNELAEEILEDSFDNAIEDATNAKIKDLPEGLKQMIQIALKGGDFSQLFTQLSIQSKQGVTKDTDMDVESNQILVMQQDLESQGYDQDYIDTHIEVLKDSGKLKAISEKVKVKVVAEQDADNEEEVVRASNQKKNNIENQRKYKLKATEYVKSVDNIRGIVINKKDKEELPSYMSDIVVKMGDGRTVTKYQKELFEIFGDKEKNTLLAKLIKDNFDFSSITNKSLTDQSKIIRDKIQQGKDIKLTGSNGSSRKATKSLADMLD